MVSTIQLLNNWGLVYWSLLDENEDLLGNKGCGVSVTVSGVSVSMSGYVCASMWCVCVGVRIGRVGISGGGGQ